MKNKKKNPLRPLAAIIDGNESILLDVLVPLAAPADTEDTIYMHNAIWEWAYGPIPDGYVVAHIDGNGLNNCRDNLCLIPISTLGPLGITHAVAGDGPYAGRPR